MDQGVIPPDLLLVMVCPVHKGRSGDSPKNYQSVALTSHLTKVFERVLRRVLVGFRTVYFQTVGMVIYTNFSKAFDKVETGC